MTTEPGKGVLIIARGWPIERWAAIVRQLAPDRPLQTWPDLRNPGAVSYAMVWKPPAGVLASLPNLEVIFSLGAGVDHLIFQDRLPEVPIVRLVNPNLTQRMTEWVVLQVLMHHRRQRVYDRQQAARQWKDIEQPAASEVSVGVMGAGVLGGDAAAVLARIGFRVATWSRRPAHIDGTESFHGTSDLDAFLARTDILVCLLPLTAETRGVLAMPLFRKLARAGALGGPVLINAGRGGLQVEADIAAAMEQGVLIGASLDVFEREPLDKASRLWGLDNVVITPHNAAWSKPNETATLILDQIAAYERGEPLTQVVDRAASY